MTLTNNNPTLVSGAGLVFTDSGTATLTLWGVQSEQINKTSGLIDMPMPVSDSNAKLAFDLMGTSRTITIEGIAVLGGGTTGPTTICNYVNDLVGLKDSPTASKNVLLSGQQGSNPSSVQAGWKYYPESLNRGRATNLYITVYVSDVSVTSDAGNPNSIKYDITLMECDGTSSA